MIATKKGVSMEHIAVMADYALPQHLKRALNETPYNIGAKRILNIANALGEKPERILMILVNGK